MQTLKLYQEMAEALGWTALEYMRKYPELTDPLLQVFKTKTITELVPEYEK